MCLGVNVHDLLQGLPDGGAVSFKHEKHNNERGFHPQEILDLAIKNDFLIVEVEADPKIGFHSGDSICVYHGSLHRKGRLKAYMSMAPSVVVGKTAIENGHAVAYDPKTNKYYDPRGHILNDCPVSIDTVFLVFSRRALSI